MLPTIQGVYREGKVELIDPPPSVKAGTPVLVTFLELGPIDLKARGIPENLAAESRVRLQAFAEDWTNPEMDPYDRYDQAKVNMPAR